MKKFSDLKKVRDSVYHGEEFSEQDLPIHEISTLLMKYLLAFMERPNQTIASSGSAEI
ncbi:hypothetical protein SBDP1_1590002 [Syntrophobacter sp. SbD1]|nr:hypothetical protein SBDP1_1590002 [Syntrophobacter sp. SbD1]